MAVNLIVAAVTVLLAGFVLVWLLCPRLRHWWEAPKYRFLEQQRRFPEVLRDGPPPAGPADARHERNGHATGIETRA